MMVLGLVAAAAKLNLLMAPNPTRCDPTATRIFTHLELQFILNRS